jgi:hypothetical protein
MFTLIWHNGLPAVNGQTAFSALRTIVSGALYVWIVSQ